MIVTTNACYLPEGQRQIELEDFVFAGFDDVPPGNWIPSFRGRCFHHQGQEIFIEFQTLGD
jgi:hypothetical protein